MTHPQSSGWRALQPGLHHSQALHPLEHREEDTSSKSPAVDGDTRRALCSQPLAQERHGGSREAQGAEDGGEGGGFGLLGAALGVSGSNNTFGFSCCSQFVTAATVSKSKSKGELWLHPYLWQSHLLSLTPPWAAGRTLPDTPCSPGMLCGRLSSA